MGLAVGENATENVGVQLVFLISLDKHPEEELLSPRGVLVLTS